jgi:hypothetical protein
MSGRGNAYDNVLGLPPGGNVLFAIAVVSHLVTAGAAEIRTDADHGAPAARPDTWRFELKRATTDRAASDESSRTTVRVERLLDSRVALLRLDIPFVDKINSFSSDPLNAGLGDLKARIGSRPLGPRGASSSPFVDVVLPTADPASLGKGKYQLGPGVTVAVPVPAPWPDARFVLAFLPQVQQYFSIAGDPDRADVNYTQLEAKLEATWPERLSLSLNPKPVIDWTNGAQTAAVVELQGTWLISRAWRLWLKAGTRLWGPTLPGTYARQTETGVRLSL